MNSGWKLTAFAPKSNVQAALLAHDEIEEWDPEFVISGREIAEERPQEWVLEGWFPRKPGKVQTRSLAQLFAGKAPKIQSQKLPDEDWLAISQKGVEPIRAGPFNVHTPDFPPLPGARNFAIPAAQAFGTGQHETTAGCLEMLALIKQNGSVVRDCADIGTGTGLLGFAALSLWPSARMTASDIDPICAQVVEDNAILNDISIGHRNGEMAIVIAAGMEHSLLQMRAPYDLLIANILAGPLIELAPDFTKAVAPGGHVVLAGLLKQQASGVRRAYRRAGFRLKTQFVRGDWTILWLQKRISK
ncbi:MAG: 50S ribosomal protein L11 methyltransferase [Erythrobacter sp.]